MNVRLQVYQGTPPDIVAVREWAVHRMSELMRPFGVVGISLKWTPVGASGAMEIDIRTADREPPGNFGVLQPKMVRWIAEGMHAFGIASIETDPTEADNQDLYRLWGTASGITVKTPPGVDPGKENDGQETTGVVTSSVPVQQ